MSIISICLVVVAALAVLSWNFVPGIRERLRGWTTMAEAALAAGLPFIGNAIDAFELTDWKAYISENAWPYIIAGLACWFIFKRVVTSTPVGEGL